MIEVAVNKIYFKKLFRIALRHPSDCKRVWLRTFFFLLEIVKLCEPQHYIETLYFAMGKILSFNFFYRTPL